LNVTHIRDRNVIRTLPQDEVTDGMTGKVTKPFVGASSETFKSVNQAKRASRALQKKPGVVLRAPR
jgi:hypothetical protein